MDGAAANGGGVRVQRVQKAFGDRTVLHDITLCVPAGGFISIVGRSGCGKSTLLRLLVGLDAPTTGTVDTGGAQARLVFQEPRLLPWASVGANVAVGLGRAPTKADEAVVQETLSLVGLGDRGGVWPSTLSGGQRQRVALARALVSHPGFLALDEPFGALDALTRLDMQGLLERVWQGQGFTAVLVTHDVAEAVALGDRVVLIDAGRIALDVPVPVERPRKPGDPRLAAIEAQVLERLFQG
jgi:sulfonate transport system ATP-binding protein